MCAPHIVNVYVVIVAWCVVSLCGGSDTRAWLLILCAVLSTLDSDLLQKNLNPIGFCERKKCGFKFSLTGPLTRSSPGWRRRRDLLPWLSRLSRRRLLLLLVSWKKFVVGIFCDVAVSPWGSFAVTFAAVNVLFAELAVWTTSLVFDLILPSSLCSNN